MRTNQPNRRVILKQIGFGVAGLVTTHSRTFGQAKAGDASTPPANSMGKWRTIYATRKVNVQNLRGDITLLMGAGCNVAVLAPQNRKGSDGKVMVDSGYNSTQPQLTASLQTLGAAPVTHLVNTHWHFDHTDGNPWLHQSGATIHAVPRTRERLSRDQYISGFELAVPALPADGLPTELINGESTLHAAGNDIALIPLGPGHTDTDLLVHFQSADILHTGDIFVQGAWPFIDYSTGGSFRGMIESVERSLQIAGAKTIVVPGHGNVGDREKLSRFLEMLVASRELVGKLKTEGRTVEEVIAARPLAAYATEFGDDASGFWIKLVYQGV